MTDPNTDTDNDPVETDGGVTDVVGADHPDADADEESLTQSLAETRLSRRTTLSGLGALGAGLAGLGGSAAATEIDASTPGTAITLPGDDVEVLRLILNSSDQLIDINGGTDTDSNDPALTDDLYETLSNDGSGSSAISGGTVGDGEYLRHPQPDFNEQSVLPGDLLSEFSGFDRVFTDAYDGYDFDADPDAAGPVFDINGDNGNTFTQHAGDLARTDFPQYFTPEGFTYSQGSLPGDCVRTLPIEGDESSVDDVTTTDGDLEIDVTFGTINANGDDIDTIEAVGLAPIAEETFAAGDIEIVDNNQSTTVAENDNEVTVGSDGQLSFELDATIAINSDDDVTVRLVGAASAIEDGDTTAIQNNLLASLLDSGTLRTVVPAIGGGLTAYPRAEVSFSTDISEVINPQFAVKVDSVGVADATVTVDLSALSSIGSGPITAADVVGEWTSSNLTVEDGDINSSDAENLLGDAGMPDAVVVDENGSIPDEFASGKTGYAITNYDSSGPELTIEFSDHRRLVTLPNAGWLSGVDSCSRPRGDVAPCDEFRCTDTSYGREDATSGVRDVSQLGLQADFRNTPESGGSYVVLDDSTVDKRDPNFDRGANISPDSRPHVLVDNYYDDDGELQNNTTVLDVVSAFDLDGLEEETLEFVDGPTGESDNILDVADASEFPRSGGSSFGSLYTTSNGFTQIPLRATDSVTNLVELSDPIQISSSPDVNLTSRGRIHATENVSRVAIPSWVDDQDDAITDLYPTVDDSSTTADDQAVLTESEAYRELDFTDLELKPPGDVRSDSNDTEVVAVIDSPGEFKSGVQLIAEGVFDCEDNTTPLYDVLNEGSEGSDTVDVTQSDRVSYRLTDSSDSGFVTDTGVVYPQSGAEQLEVEAAIDGCFDDSELSAGSVTVTVIDHNDFSSGSFPAGLGDAELNDRVGSDIIDPLPAGESIQTLFTAVLQDADETELTGVGDVSPGTAVAIDLTNTIDASGERAAVAYTDEGDTSPVPRGAASPDDAADPTASPDPNDLGDGALTGVVNMGAVQGTTGEEITAELTADVDFAITGNSDGPAAGAGLTASTTYQAQGNYVLAAAGAPSLHSETVLGSVNAAPVVKSDDFGRNNNIVLLETESRSDPDQVAVDPLDLNNPSDIATAIEDGINEAVDRDREDFPDEGPVVEAEYNAGPFAGYVVRSVTEVESSFDQSVDVSSVEITDFVSVAEDKGISDDDAASRTSDYNYAQVDKFDTDGDKNDYVERQDINPALGLPHGNFNEQDAITVETGSGTPEYIAPTYEYAATGSPGSELADRYAARADPFDQVDSGSIERQLGDLQLTCNVDDVAAYRYTELGLVGAEDPDATDDLGLEFHTVNPRVFTFYDSQAQEVWESVGYDSFFVGGSSTPSARSVRAGAPNMREGDLPILVHNDSKVYDAILNGSNSVGDFDGYERARFRTAVTISSGGGSSSVEVRGLSEFGEAKTDGPALPFFEAFDIVEAGDAIASESGSTFEPNPAEDVPPSLVNAGDARGLSPKQSFVQNCYGNRFEGLTVRNEGSLSLNNVRRHVLEIANAADRDFIPGDDPAPLDREGVNRSPIFPEDEPDQVVFIRDDVLYSVSSPTTSVREAGFDQQSIVGTDPNLGTVTSASGLEFPKSFFGVSGLKSAFVWTDEADRPDIWFGTGVGDEAEEYTVNTTCGTEILDGLVLSVEARLDDDDALIDDSLEYEIDDRDDRNSNGIYESIRPEDAQQPSTVSAGFQDTGLYFESHDDTGGLVGDQIVIGQDNNGDNIVDEYDGDGDGDIGIAELRDAIADWRNGNITIGELREVINAWRNSN